MSTKTCAWRLCISKSLVISYALLIAGCGQRKTSQELNTQNVQGGSEGYLPASSLWVQESAKIDPTALPLDDQHYTTDGPEKGYIYVCDPKMFQQEDGPGARAVGSWVDQVNGTYDVTTKIFIRGDVTYDNASFSNTTSDDQRNIASNGLPLPDAFTGTFPVEKTDPAYPVDPNPNSVQPQAIAFSIPANPQLDDQIGCVYKEVGITLDGIPLHNPLDSSGNNELGYEGQDLCLGGPQPNGGYHRHGPSDCTPHMHESAALVGYALDGFGIYSPFDENGNELVSADLDACHGRTSPVMWNGRVVNMYHYVMTRDFPYSVACFMGTAARNAFPPLGPKAPPQSPGQLPASSDAPPPPSSDTPPPSDTPPSDPPPPAPDYSGIDTSCLVFAPDDNSQAQTQIASQSAAQCQNALTNLNQIYVQFEGKTCAEMQQIISSRAPGPNGQPLPPPPIPNGTIYNALVSCAQQ